MKKYFLIMPLILIIMSLQGCLYYDYGVDKNKVKLEYPSYYSEGRNKDVIFDTVLYSEQKDLEGKPNYIRFTVYTNNIQKELVGPDKESWVSSLYFDFGVEGDKVQILKDTIKIIHKDKDGNILLANKEEDNIDKCVSSGWHRCNYKKVYGKKSLPKAIEEYIYLEVIVNGKRIIIEKTYPLELKYHYSHWDIMMGV